MKYEASHVVVVVKNLHANARDKRCWFDPWVRKIPWRRAWQPTPAFLLESPTDRGACQATGHRASQSGTQLHALSEIDFIKCGHKIQSWRKNHVNSILFLHFLHLLLWSEGNELILGLWAFSPNFSVYFPLSLSCCPHSTLSNSHLPLESLIPLVPNGYSVALGIFYIFGWAFPMHFIS